MAYSPPAANAVNFDFTATGYTAPAAGAVNFNFLIAENDRLTLGQQYAVGGESSDGSILGQLWAVEPSYTDAAALDQQYAVVAVATDASELLQQWLIDVGGEQLALDQAWQVLTPEADALALTQQWAVVLELNDALLVDQLYAIASVDTDILPLEQLYAIPEVLSDESQLLQRYIVDGLGADLSIVTQQWAVEFTPGETLGFDTQYAVTAVGADLEWLTQQWALSDVPITEAVQLTQEWIVTGASASDLVLPLLYGIGGILNDRLSLDGKWSIANYVGEELMFDQAWYFYYTIRAANLISYGQQVSRPLQITYDLGTSIVKQSLNLTSDLTVNVRRCVYLRSDMGNVRAACLLTSPLFDTVRRSCELTSPIRERVQRAVRITYDLAERDRVRRDLKIVYPLMGDAVVIVTDRPVLTIDGQVVDILDAEVSIDEGQFAWTCQVQLANPAHYDLFAPDAEFTIDMLGELYTFIVDDKRRQRQSGVDVSATISGISPSALLSDPRAVKVTKTWTDPIAVSDLFDELLEPYGLTIDIRTLDWTIAGLRLAAQAESPMSIIQRVAAAIGAYIECDPDGALFMRYRYPVSVPSYALAMPDQEYDDQEHNFTLSESLTSQQVANKLRIMDVAVDSFRDTIEFVPDASDPTKGTLKVWPNPWRDTFDVSHTSLPIVSIEQPGVEVSEVLVETVEFVRGQANVAKPIDSITSVAWRYADLGGVSFARDDTKLTSSVQAESLAEITYQTRYYAYRVVAYPNAKVQFVVMEEA